MSRPPSGMPSSAATPIPSSPPPPSESFLSELDGTAPSVLDAGEAYNWDQSRVDPTSLNLVSWKLGVHAVAEDGVNKRGFNAISTVLNHPTKKANPLRSSRKPLPPLSQSQPQLPKPPPPSFYDPYLKSVSPLFDSFKANGASSIAGPSSITLNDTVTDVANGKDLPPLDRVPDLFFDPAFNLSSPSTWDAVVGFSASSTRPNADARTEDQLSSHLDVLERHLIHEITLRSSAFFSALSNLQDLHSESSSCLARISSLQSSLQGVGSQQAQKGLDIIEEHDQLRVLRKTDAGMKQLVELDDLIRIAQVSVDAGDWAGGLGYLEDIVRWWENHGRGDTPENSPSPPEAPPDAATEDKPSDSLYLPLSDIPALKTLPTLFSQLAKSISTQLQTTLKSLLVATLSRSETSDSFDKEDFSESVRPILAGLAECGETRSLEDVWGDVLTTSIREGSRKHLPVLNHEDEPDEEARPDDTVPQQRGANLATSLRSMDHSRFLLLSSQMFSTVLARLLLAQQIGNAMTDVLAGVKAIPSLSLKSEGSATRPINPGEPEASVDLLGPLASACELANVRASKVLAVRAEQNAELPLSEFVEIFKESWDFVMATEQLAQRMIVSLRGVSASQARAFLVRYHSVRLTKSAKLVEEEQWTQIDVTHNVQHVVNLLIESAVSDPLECFIPSRQTAANGDVSQPNAKALDIEDKSFHVVKATAESLVLLSDYMKIVVNLELVVTDVMSRVVEFLKSFNSRTCQVVLGAGAMRSAGLKNITAKHLALASQSLSIVISLLPYIREFIRRHLSVKQAVMLTEFDKLRRDYQDHQNEIHAKLVAIMSDRLAVHCGSLREIDWEATPDKEGPHAYVELLVKETATLHKVLSKYLAPSTVNVVMSEVLSAIVGRFSEEYGKVEIKSEDARTRMLQDASLVVSRLSPLIDDASGLESLEASVKAKALPRRPVGQTMRGLIGRVGSSGSPRVPGEISREPTPVNAQIEDTPGVERQSEDVEVLAVPDLSAEGEPVPSRESHDPAQSPAVSAATAPANVDTKVSEILAKPTIVIETEPEVKVTPDITEHAKESPVPMSPVVASTPVSDQPVRRTSRLSLADRLAQKLAANGNSGESDKPRRSVSSDSERVETGIASQSVNGTGVMKDEVASPLGGSVQVIGEPTATATDPLTGVLDPLGATAMVQKSESNVAKDTTSDALVNGAEDSGGKGHAEESKDDQKNVQAPADVPAELPEQTEATDDGTVEQQPPPAPGVQSVADTEIAQEGPSGMADAQDGGGEVAADPPQPPEKD